MISGKADIVPDFEANDNFVMLSINIMINKVAPSVFIILDKLARVVGNMK